MVTATGIPKKPKTLKGTASQLWDTVCQQQKNYLSESDGTALFALCELWALRERAGKVLEKYPTDKDARIAFTNYHDRAEKLLAKFGMTPSDRARLGEVSKQDHNPAAEFIA
jgi:P27 family predicted phage terminase small subunit